ncbi:MAG: PAS domain S-box protein [Acidimicrobiia bacterium]|nr:PAS domain S-box protein [Acidimicrobiia bacterium]
MPPAPGIGGEVHARRLRALAERALSAGTAGLDPETTGRVRLLNWFTLVAVPAALALAVFSGISGLRSSLDSALAAFVLIGGGRVLLAVSAGLTVAGNVMVAGVWACGVVPAFSDDMLGPANLLVVALTPFVASRLLPRVWLTVWTPVAVASLAVLITTADFGVSHGAEQAIEIFAWTVGTAVLVFFGASASSEVAGAVARAGRQDRFTRSVLDASPAMIALHDADGRLVLVNDVFARMARVADAEAVLARQDELVARAPDFVAAELRENSEILDTGTRVSRDVTVSDQNGRLRTFHLSKSRIAGPDGHPYVLTVATDVTEREEAEAARAAADARFRLAFRQSQIGMAFIDVAGRFTEANPVMGETLGCSDNELIGAPVRSFVHPDDRTTVEHSARRLLQGKTDGVRHRLRLRRVDGHYRWADVHAHPLEGGGRRNGFWIQAVDVTQMVEARLALEAARDEAEEANRAKSDLLAAVSYEMRTPMTDVLGMADVLLDTELDTEQRAELATVRASTERLLDIVGSVLDYARIEAGSFEVQRVGFDLSDVLADVARRAAEAALSQGLEFRTYPHECSLSRFRGDPDALRRILGNVVSNATRFTDSGHVELGVSCEPLEAGGSLVRVTVSDTGRGIPPELRDRIFDEFTRVDEATGGTGLGLTIARRIVEMMGGRIGVESELGVGSTFWIELPLETATEGAYAPDVAATPATGSPAATGPRPLRVLVVEDNAVNQKVLVRMLAALGHASTVVANGADAVQACTAESYDVILMDCAMPVMDGYEATRRIRALPGDVSATPIIAVTAHAMKGVSQRCFEAGMDDYLAKPFGIRELGTVLAAWSEATHTRRAEVGEHT